VRREKSREVKGGRGRDRGRENVRREEKQK